MMKQWPLIVLVEDSPTQARQIAATLSDYEVEIVIAEDGLQALRIIDGLKPDLVILDINLPKMDGFQICYRLKRDNTTCNIPVVILTSMDNADATLHGLEVGADDYLPKDTFTAANLLVTVNSFLKIIKK
jgi:DNA-binding response OmpR family regulator